MTEQDFLAKRIALKNKKQAQEKIIDIEYTAVLKEFLDKNSPVQKNIVYELVENGRKRRGFKRIIFYDIDVNVWDESIMIIVGGWWLNENNVPTKWDNMTVSGIRNPAIFKPSENQNAEKHPQSNDN